MATTEAALVRYEEHDVIRSHHNDICCVLSRSEETLMQFAGMLYEKKIIDVHTKNTVIRKKGYEGADMLMDRVEMKVEQTPTQLRRVLRTMKKLEDLEVISRKIGGKRARSRRKSVLVTENDRSSEGVGSIKAPSSVGSSFCMVVETAETLKKAFENLLVFVLSMIANVDVPVLKLKLNWYISSELQNTPEVNKHLDELQSVKTPDAVLNFLINRHFVGYLNYELLEVFRDIVSNDELLSKIQKYKADHDKFLQSTNFKTLVEVFQNNPKLRPVSAVGLPNFTLHLKSPWEGKDTYSWKDLLDKQFNWPPHVHVTKITRKCVIIEYSVLPFFAPAVVRDLTDPLVLVVLKRQGVTVKLSLELIKMGREEILQMSGKTPLHSAALSGRTDLVEVLVKDGADVHIEDESGDTPLHIAAMFGEPKMIEILINHGASANKENLCGNTPLHFAALSDKANVAEMLIKHGADIHKEDVYGDTPIDVAAMVDHKDTVELLAKYGANSVHQSEKETVLFPGALIDGLQENISDEALSLRHAVICGDIDKVKELIEDGVDIHERNELGETPLHLAVTQSTADVVKILTNYGANIHKQDECGVTPLHLAVMHGDTDIVKIFIAYDVEVHRVNQIGETLLHLASKSGKTDVAKMLLEMSGAQLDKEDDSGETPLHLAAIHGHADTVKLLLEHGADLCREDNYGETPIHLAAMYGGTEMVKMLIEYDADIYKESTSGNTPLHFAAMSGKADVVDMLVEHGLDVNKQDRSDNTPLHFAVMSAKVNAAKMLVRHGAHVDKKNEDGITPLDLAKTREMINTLIDLRSQERSKK